MERLIERFVPGRYILDIAIDKYKKTIGGVVTAKGEVLRETVKFHAVGLKVTDVLVNGEKVKFKADGEVLEIFDARPGEAEITIYYNGMLKENMEERCQSLAAYIIENKATVRAAAKKFGISKSTVHKDLSDRLPQFNRTLYLQVKLVLEENKAQRHIRGGMATRKKYKGE